MTNYQKQLIGKLQIIASNQFCDFGILMENLTDYCNRNNLVVTNVDIDNYCFTTSDCQIISFNEII